MTIPNTLSHLVFEVPNFVTASFCARMIAMAEERGFEHATIRSQDGVAVRPDIRNNDRLIFDNPALAKRLWPSLLSKFTGPFKGARATGLNPRFRLYRYEPGQFFDWHQDGAYRPDERHETRFTLLIYLNADFDGGGTSFADVLTPHVFADFTVAPATGKALLFHHPLSHKGEPVTRGHKYVLRTDVVFQTG